MYVVFFNLHEPDDLDFAYNWHIFTQHFSAVAVEYGLTATLFSADSFDRFLASSRASAGTVVPRDVNSDFSRLGSASPSGSASVAAGALPEGLRDPYPVD